MVELPKIVAQTDVGKKVQVKVWRNKREITKTITLGRLETSEDFKQKTIITEKPKEVEIEGLKVTVRLLDKKDIEDRQLPKGTTGVVITNIAEDSPVNYLQKGDIIVEAQKRKINTIGDLANIIKVTLRSSEKTLLIAIYNNQKSKKIYWC